MTGLISLAKTLAITALAASGLLMAGGEFSASGPADVSSEGSAGTTTGIETGEASTTDTTTDSPAHTQTSDSTDCLDDCLVPCATACADPQRPPLDGAAQEGAAFGAAVAPEPPIAEATGTLDAQVSASAETDSPSTGLGVSAGEFVNFETAGN